MGKLVSGNIPSLISGISQQPENVRLISQGAEQVNCYSTLTDFLKRRPSTQHKARISNIPLQSPCACHFINRDINEKYNCLLSKEHGVIITDLEGSPRTVNVSSSAEAYINLSDNFERDLRFLTINDFTFVLNTQVTTKTSTERTYKRPAEALVFIKQASYNTTYYLTLDGVEKSFTTADGVAPVDQPADPLSSEQIALSLANQFDANIYNILVENSTLYISRRDIGSFSIEVKDSRSNTHIVTFKDKVQDFSDLPSVAVRDYVVEILGDASSSFDNYYVKFEPKDDTSMFGSGLWKETVQPDALYKLDASTMPHVIKRTEDGSFSFEAIEWDNRACGDDNTVPFPSFVDKKLANLFFYRNRLSFLAEDNIIMSEAGYFFNFFATTATTKVDSDVIDIACASTNVNNLKHATVYSGGLLLFSEQSQYMLEHDTVLSLSTVSIKPATEFEASMLTSPVSSGRTVFFATDKGKYSGIREYYNMSTDYTQNDAQDVTAHVPMYIEGNVKKLTVSTNEDVLLVHTDTNPKDIWVYKYLWNGNEKVQNAWGKWEMTGDVITSFFYMTELYLIIAYHDGIYIEKASVASGYKDEEATHEYYLDRKVNENEVTMVFSDLSHTTDIVLPYDITDLPLVCVSRGSNNGNIYQYTKISNDTICIEGDLRDTKFFIGVPFHSYYTFSTFSLRDNGQGNAISDGRLQLRNITLNCVDTGYLEVSVTPLFRDENIYSFSGRTIGNGYNIIGKVPLYTGTLRYSVLSRNTQVKIKVQSSSYLPFSIVNVDWEGFYNTRNKRI